MVFQFLRIPEIYSGATRRHLQVVFLSVCARFLVSSEKTVRAIAVRPFFRVHKPSERMRAFALFRGARCTWHALQYTFKNGFHAPIGQTLQRRIIKFCKKKRHRRGGGEYVLLVAAAAWGAQDACTTHGIESIVGSSTRKIRIIERLELSMPKLTCGGR